MSTGSHACEFCGLPVSSPAWGKAKAAVCKSSGPVYCCFGCRFAHAVTQEQGASGAARWTLIRLGLAVFFTMNAMVFTVALWAYDSVTLQAEGTTAILFADLFRWFCLLCSLPVLFLLGVPLGENAWRELRRGRMTTDLLLIAGVLAAYAYSVVSVWRGVGDIYFEVGCMILVFVTLGRWLEATGKLKSTEALDHLTKLLPEQVVRVDGPQQETVIRLTEVRVGDSLRVRPGERIPTDGILSSQRTTVDEQLVTGESFPIEKHPGNRLVGGTLNLDGLVEMEVTAPPEGGTLSRLVLAVRQARLRQGRYQKLADRVVTWLIPVVILLAAIAWIGHGWRSGFPAGMLSALSVVLIACPCALGIATPLAVWSAIGSAARRGIVIQNGETLERLAEVGEVFFDKTGTLTTGQPVVSRFLAADMAKRSQVLSTAVRLAESSPHPFSQAIVEWSDALPAKLSWSEVVARPGLGIIARLPGTERPTVLGSHTLCEELGLAMPESLATEWEQAVAAGDSVTLVGWDGQVHGLFTFAEQLRADASAVVQRLQQGGIDVTVLTGDHPGRGKILADRLRVPVSAGLAPGEKLDHVTDVQRRRRRVAMVGDGINDAAAIAAADVGIALGCGADVTRESADVCLVSNELSQIPWLLDLSRRSLQTIRRNLAWAFGYNSLGIGLALTGFLHPSLAAMLMVGSSLIVITNSLRLTEEVLDRESPGDVPLGESPHREVSSVVSMGGTS